MKHLSSEEISQYVAGDCTPAERHLGECAECAGAVENARQAIALFCASATQWSEREAALPTRRPALFHRLAVALAACLLAAIALMRTQTPAAPAAPQFLEFPYVAPLAPYERAQIERMDVPVAALVAAGFQVRTADTAAVVRADVLLGQDGRAHAIRLVSDFDRSLIQ